MPIPLARSLVLLLFTFFNFALAANEPPVHYQKSATLSYQLVTPTDSPVKPLVTISYDPTERKHSLFSWSPPVPASPQSATAGATSSKLVRILLPDGSSSVTTLDTFSEGLHQKIDLWLSPDDGSVFSASVSPLTPPPLTPEEERYQKKVARAKAKGKPIPARPPVPNSKKAREEAARQLALFEPIKVNLMTAQARLAPTLATRAPPVVGADGREIVEDPQQEKSLLQKYWWVGLILVLLTMGGGGGEK
ncbi:hypothetical protein PV10_07343 [Exophiala mesophila]|uniref:ER membrane protein complex subunit 10 n=1 Tax=Exophiala mesophila TaxID=212818 RepID=A0A0D1ZT97_EXOME|nr:uncharacterized protein PV10_07343 [Exophiala mesophila]KIV89993.1 hypothetical protein PV10_07343 [Exophiala mesophila]